MLVDENEKRKNHNTLYLVSMMFWKLKINENKLLFLIINFYFKNSFLFFKLKTILKSYHGIDSNFILVAWNYYYFLFYFKKLLVENNYQINT